MRPIVNFKRRGTGVFWGSTREGGIEVELWQNLRRPSVIRTTQHCSTTHFPLNGPTPIGFA